MSTLMKFLFEFLAKDWIESLFWHVFTKINNFFFDFSTYLVFIIPFDFYELITLHGPLAASKGLPAFSSKKRHRLWLLLDGDL